MPSEPIHIIACAVFRPVLDQLDLKLRFPHLRVTFLPANLHVNPAKLYDPEKHHRRSIRLKGYDYSQPGAYFITIVTRSHECLLEPEPIRDMVQHWWDKLPTKFPTVESDVFVVMPNHIHGIILIVGMEPTGLTRGTGLTHGSAPTEMGDAGGTRQG